MAMDDTPGSPRPRARAALLLVPVLLIALGLPLALHLDVRTAAAVTFGILAASALASSAMRRVLGQDMDADTALRDLTTTLPQGALLLVDGRLRAANPAARALLGLGEADVSTLDPLALFVDPLTAHAVLDDAPVDRELRLRRLDGTHFEACLSAGQARFAHGHARLLLFVDRSDDQALAARLDSQRMELQTLTRRLMTVQEDERASLSRELHDDIGQAITAIKLCASSLGHEPDPPRHAVVQETAHEIATIADQTVAKLRDLSLLLRPPQLDALGLDAALRWQARALFRNDYPKLALDIPPLDCRPPRDVELACFRIAQEALTNVLRHARAGRVHLHLACDDDALRLRIEDDGCGISAGHRAGLGLITMRERAAQLGGRLDIDSRPGRTCIEVTLPLANGADAAPDAERVSASAGAIPPAAPPSPTPR